MKDFLGNELNIGDEIVFLDSYKLSSATITGFVEPAFDGEDPYIELLVEGKKGFVGESEKYVVLVQQKRIEELEYKIDNLEFILDDLRY